MEPLERPHMWFAKGQVRTCLTCGTAETYWDDEEYPNDPCPDAEPGGMWSINDMRETVWATIEEMYEVPSIAEAGDEVIATDRWDELVTYGVDEATEIIALTHTVGNRKGWTKTYGSGHEWA